MHVSYLDKEEFLEWLGGRANITPKKLSIPLLKKALRHDVALIWEGWPAPDSARPLVAVSRSAMADFYAFVGTYVSTYRPFSAFFRVVPYESLPSLLSVARSNVNDCRLPESFIGVAIAEAYVQTQGKIQSTHELSIPAVLATLSATMVSAIWEGYGPDSLTAIAERWWVARSINTEDHLTLHPGKVAEAWMIVADAFCKNEVGRLQTSTTQRKLISALRSASEADTTVDSWLQPLVKGVPSLSDIPSRIQRAREERVRVYREALDALVGFQEDALFKEFLAGSLLSMVGNGSFDFLPMLGKTTSEMPAAALWFAILSSFQKNNDALSTGNCLGRRAARDLFRGVSLFDVPSEDISLEEFEIYRRDTLARQGFRSGQNQTISVGLFGTIAGRFRLERTSKPDATIADDERIKRRDAESLKEVLFLLDRVRSVVRRVSDDRQRDLFDNGSRRPLRKP